MSTSTSTNFPSTKRKKVVTTIHYRMGSDGEWHKDDKTVVIEEWDAEPPAPAQQYTPWVSPPVIGPYVPPIQSPGVPFPNQPYVTWGDGSPYVYTNILPGSTASATPPEKPGLHSV